MNKLLSASVLTLAVAFSGSALAAFQGPGLAPSTVAEALMRTGEVLTFAPKIW